MDIVTSERTYLTRKGAVTALTNVLTRGGLTLEQERWLVAVKEDGRFVPVLVGTKYIQFMHFGIMIVG